MEGYNVSLDYFYLNPDKPDEKAWCAIGALANTDKRSHAYGLTPAAAIIALAERIEGDANVQG